MSKVSFFSSFYGTCLGVKIFTLLRTHSWKRTIFHLFLLSIISGVVVALFASSRLSPQVDAIKVAFQEKFGSTLLIGNNGFFPALEPSKCRTLALPFNSLLIYHIDSQVNPPPKPELIKGVTGMLILWTPEGVYFFSNGENKQQVFLNFKSGSWEKNFDNDDVNVILSKVPKLPDSLPQISGEVETIFSHLKNAFVASYGLIQFCRAFFMVWLYTGMFMFITMIFNKKRYEHLSLREMWKCGVYASFPPIAVATMFPALDLPIFSYETIFMLGMLIYWMVVINYLENNLRKEEIKL